MPIFTGQAGQSWTSLCFTKLITVYLSNALLSHTDVNLPQLSGEVIHLDYTEIYYNKTVDKA